MAIETQNIRTPTKAEPTSPSEYLKLDMSTLILQIRTHCAKMHMPDATMSKVYPRLLMVYYKDRNVSVHRKNEKKTGNTNQIATRLMLKSLLLIPSLYRLGFSSDYELVCC